MGVGNSKGLVASRGISLLEAFRFCKFVMSIPIPDDLLSNPRVKGRADRLSAEQGEYHPARSLTATEVASLEKMMLTEMNHVDKYMLGAVLFCLYSRSRWSDVKHIQQFWIEEGSHEGELFGFIEGRTQHHKCATSVVKKHQFMPLVCPLPNRLVKSKNCKIANVKLLVKNLRFNLLFYLDLRGCVVTTIYVVLWRQSLHLPTQKLETEPKPT